MTSTPTTSFTLILRGGAALFAAWTLLFLSQAEHRNFRAASKTSFLAFEYLRIRRNLSLCGCPSPSCALLISPCRRTERPAGRSRPSGGSSPPGSGGSNAAAGSPLDEEVQDHLQVDLQVGGEVVSADVWDHWHELHEEDVDHNDDVDNRLVELLLNVVLLLA